MYVTSPSSLCFVLFFVCFCTCNFVMAPFKLALSTLFANLFLWTSLQFIFNIMVSSGGIPKLSILFIYNSTWSILIQWIQSMTVMWQYDLGNTKSIFPVCDKPYHTNIRNIQKGEEIEVLRNSALYFRKSG